MSNHVSTPGSRPGIEIGVILPTSTPDPTQPILGDVGKSARFAEELGLDSVWSTDHLRASGPMLDSTVVLSVAAAVTERVTIGYNVMLLALRPVAWAAKHISTLQYVSGDRLVLGVGTGNPAHGDIGWLAAGKSFADRGRRTDEALRVLPDLVTGKPAEVEDGVRVELVPGATMPPVMIAGDGKAALRRAARFGDAWATIAAPPETVAAKLTEITRLAAEFGRPPIRATVVAPDLGTDPAQAAARLAAYEEAGVERVILAPSGADWRSGYEFAAAVKLGHAG